MIYVFEAIDYSPDEVNEFKTDKEFLEYYQNLNKIQKEKVYRIIKGNEYKPVIKTKEVIKEYKLQKGSIHKE